MLTSDNERQMSDKKMSDNVPPLKPPRKALSVDSERQVSDKAGSSRCGLMASRSLLTPEPPVNSPAGPIALPGQESAPSRATWRSPLCHRRHLLPWLVQRGLNLVAAWLATGSNTATAPSNSKQPASRPPLAWTPRGGSALFLPPSSRAITPPKITPTGATPPPFRVHFHA
jgi:hypothetical protein